MPQDCAAQAHPQRSATVDWRGRTEELWGNERELRRLIGERLLTAVFQPILDFRVQCVGGYEALIRPPADSPLDTPARLFQAARFTGLTLPLERVCMEVILGRFAALDKPGMLFINVSPPVLTESVMGADQLALLLRRYGLSPRRVVLELTEHSTPEDFERTRAVLSQCRQLGIGIAIDDLGEGFSSLRLWSEVRPEYVKIDRHFISGIAQDPLKFQFVRAIRDIAETCSSQIIAEGIESEEEFATVRDLGIHFGQGYYIAHPQPEPQQVLSSQVVGALRQRHIIVYPGQSTLTGAGYTARSLLRTVEPVAPNTPNEEVYNRLQDRPEEESLPVVADGVPVGLINRRSLMDGFARPFRRELFGRRPCSVLMDAAPMIVDADIPVPELSRLMSRSRGRNHLADGFIITESGRYIGLGSSPDLMSLITEMQIRAARYANPLTQLPGNVPIDEHIDRLLAKHLAFTAAYCDLDHFKAFNDVYGYRQGDDMIALLAGVLAAVVDQRNDFLGHIGGDDFLVLFQSEDWHARCTRALNLFDAQVGALISPEDRHNGSILAEDRLGRRVFHPLPCLSIGALQVAPGFYGSHHEISAAAAEAKKMAKMTAGSALFVERRKPAARRSDQVQAAGQSGPCACPN